MQFLGSFSPMHLTNKGKHINTTPQMSLRDCRVKATARRGLLGSSSGESVSRFLKMLPAGISLLPFSLHNEWQTHTPQEKWTFRSILKKPKLSKGCTDKAKTLALKTSENKVKGLLIRQKEMQFELTGAGAACVGCFSQASERRAAPRAALWLPLPVRTVSAQDRRAVLCVLCVAGRPCIMYSGWLCTLCAMWLGPRCHGDLPYKRGPQHLGRRAPLSCYELLVILLKPRRRSDPTLSGPKLKINRTCSQFVFVCEQVWPDVACIFTQCLLILFFLGGGDCWEHCSLLLRS